MKLTKRVLSVAIMSVMGAAYLPTAEAGVSATVSGSNMYLWRGQAISGASPEISGSLDYKHDSGLFAGVWGSSEGPANTSNETDLYAGYSGKSGDFSYGVALWQYIYSLKPGSNDLGADSDGVVTDPSEWQVTLGYGPVSFGVLVDTNDSGNQYYTLGYTYGKFSAVYGWWKLDLPKDTVGEYGHLDLFFQATPELKFGLSTVVDPAEAKASETFSGPILYSKTNGKGETKQESDPLFYVSYSKTFDL
ncbi:MAG TPA: TorF family putative porin [Pseudomonadales bacterium]|nr:TorF family putative porin [Pseudomonadales bacterium]